jgi:hypothetical protein
MTDPVAPPSPGGQFPPPNAGPQGFPPPPNADGQFPPPAPFPGTESKPKGTFLRKALGILGAVVVGVIFLVIKIGIGDALSEDPTKDAKAGDCLGVSQQVTDSTTQVDAEVVECSSSDAKYTVVGRVEGVKDALSTACDDIINSSLKEGEEGAVIASQEGDGYLLCVKVN